MIILKASERYATARVVGRITTGSVGIPVELELSDDFDGLAVTVCFECGGDVADVVWYDGAEVTVPAQLLEHEGVKLNLGVYGANTSGEIVIPTIWATAGFVNRGVEPSGVDPSEPEPDWTAQVQSIAAEAIETANSVRADADAGEFDGPPGPQGDPAPVDMVQDAVNDWLDEHPEAITAVHKSVASIEDVLSLSENVDIPWVDGGSRGVYATDGSLHGSNIVNHTDYVVVKQFSSITYKRMSTTASTGSFGMAFYDDSKQFISGETLIKNAESYAYSDSTIAVPDTAAFARFSIFNSESGVTGEFSVTGVSMLTTEMDDLRAVAESSLDVVTSMQTIPDSIAWRAGYVTTSGSFVTTQPYNNWSTTYILDAKKFTTLYVMVPQNRQCTIARYDKDSKEFVSRTDQITGDSIVVKNDYDVRISVATFTSGSSMTFDEVMEGVTILADWKYSKWCGKKLVAMGDSITYGTGVTVQSSRWWNQLGRLLDCSSFSGMGVSGSCYSVTSNYGTDHSPISQRWNTIPTDADLVVLFAGTNDYGHNTPLGSITDTTDVGFYGALYSTLTGIIAANPDVRLVVMTPIHRWGYTSGLVIYDTDQNGQGLTLKSYVDAIKAMCERIGVACVDCFAMAGIVPSVSVFKEAYVPDGLHPNDAGHTILTGYLRSVFEAL